MKSEQVLFVKIASLDIQTKKKIDKLIKIYYFFRRSMAHFIA